MASRSSGTKRQAAPSAREVTLRFLRRRLAENLKLTPAQVFALKVLEKDEATEERGCTPAITHSTPPQPTAAPLTASRIVSLTGLKRSRADGVALPSKKTALHFSPPPAKQLPLDHSAGTVETTWLDRYREANDANAWQPLPPRRNRNPQRSTR